MVRDDLKDNVRFREFIREVESELERLKPETPRRADSLQAEKELLEEQCDGWATSLGDRKLSSALRAVLQDKFDIAQARIQEIVADLNALSARSNARDLAVDPERIIDGLQHLEDILAGQNASAVNLMLSQHIDGIYCDSAGRVVVRTCRLGALAGALDLVPRDEIGENRHGTKVDPEVYQAVSRRRAKLNVGDTMPDDDYLADAIEFAVDPERFGGLGPEWFTEDSFVVPPRLSWAEANAREVAEYRLRTKQSMELTAQYFLKTVPTIRASLRYAKDVYGLDAFGTQISMSTRSNWSRENADQVAAFFGQPGATMKGAVACFRKTEPTIRKALDFFRAAAAGQHNIPR